MENVGALFMRVLTVSAGSSAVLAPLLLLAPRIRKRVAARSFYVLFLLLALRLAVPVELTLPGPVVTVSAPEYMVSVPAPSRPAPVQVQAPAAVGAPAATPATPVQAAPARREVPVTSVLGLVWAAGLVLCVAWALGGYLLARRRLLRGSAPAAGAEAALLEDLRRELGVKRRVRLRRSAAVGSALALGLLCPVIVLPEGERGGEDLGLILRHELTHIRRWDVAYKLVLSTACAVNWFNPLVWLMSRAAGRNLELCCDDEVVRGLPEGERRRYGRVLLDAAETARPLAFSTSFSGGKRQLKDRLTNLFTEKKNSAILVCAVLAAALLAGGLVACESAGGAESADNAARRELLETYFYENYEEDTASVVLADLTGDGLEELLVIRRDPDMTGRYSLRDGLRADDLTWMDITFYMVENGEVVRFPGNLDYGEEFTGTLNTTISGSHAGWGYEYLIPNPAGTGYALFDFRPYSGMGQFSYSYGVYTLGENGAYTVADAGNVFFNGDPLSSMGADVETNNSPEEVQDLLARVDAYKAGGVALLVYQGDYSDNSSEFAYLNAAPEDVFSGALPMDLSSLREHVVSEGKPAQLALPQPHPGSPEAALEQLGTALQDYESGLLFRLPPYDGTWDIRIAGWMRTEGDNFMSVRYLEDTEWVSGGRYFFDVGEDAWFSELNLWAQATGPDGKSAERTFVLAKDGYVGQFRYEQMAYIKELDGPDLTVNAVEWVEIPGERAGELGLTENDGPNGFYIHDLELEMALWVNPICTITVLDRNNSYQPKTVTAEEFEALLQERGAQNAAVPYLLTGSYREGVTAITEYYVP